MSQKGRGEKMKKIIKLMACVLPAISLLFAIAALIVIIAQQDHEQIKIGRA